MHSPPGQHEVLLTNGSNHALKVGLGSAAAIPISKHSCGPVSHDLCTQQHVPDASSADIVTHLSHTVGCRWYVLAEEYTYPSFIESVIIPKGYKPLGVKLDQGGIRPESLLEVCSE